DVGEDRRGAIGDEGFGGVAERPAGIDDVVEQDAVAAFDAADDVHHLGFAGALAALVDDGERRVDALGEGAGADDAPDVGRHHRDVGDVVVLLDVAGHHRNRIEVVGGDVEEALDLAGVEIEGEGAVGAGAGDEVGDELGGNRRAGAGFAVLPGIAEIGDHRRDALGRGAAQGIDDYEELHQVVVGGVAGRLDDEDVLTADVFHHLDEDFLV